MKIGIDLDDVVFECTKFLLEEYKKDFGRNINFEDLISYELYNIWHLDKQETFDFFKNKFVKENIENLELCEFAKEVIIKLFEDNEIFFITSRMHKDGTLESLNNHFSEINFELIFSSNPYYESEGKPKGEICSNLGIDFMIEDNQKHSKICAENGIKVLLLEKPWNKNCVEHENIIRVKDWKEILEKINGN